VRSKQKRCKQTFLIGIGGGTASGKTSVCRAVVKQLGLPWVQILSMDCFYRPLTESERANVDDYNFDHPNAFDWDLLLNVLQELKSGKAVKCPQYDFTTHSRKKEHTLMYGADVVLCEGILILHHPEVLQQFDVKVFVQTDDDIRLIRRIQRDLKERGRTLQSILSQYQKTVKPSYDLFCAPTASKADIVIPRGRDNFVAIALLSDHVKNKLIEGGNVKPLFFAAADKQKSKQDALSLLPDNILLPDKQDQELQRKAQELCHNEPLDDKQLVTTVHWLCSTLLRLCVQQFIPRALVMPSPCPTPSSLSRSASRSASPFPRQASDTQDGIVLQNIDDMLHSIDEHCKASHEDKKQNEIEEAVHMNGGGSPAAKQSVCVVTVFSGGMLFGDTIMDTLGSNTSLDVQYGSMHIFHESHKPSKPRFYDRQLPPNIAQQKVVVVDAFIGTGNRARMALQVIIDHHVPPSNICFVSLVASHAGIVNLARVFPECQFITALIQSNNNNGMKHHWETRPVTSELTLRFCKAAGIDIVKDDSN